MFFRDRAGHNHIVHSILTCLALGAAPEDIQRAYDNGVGIQRPIPDIDAQMVKRLSDNETIHKCWAPLLNTPRSSSSSKGTWKSIAGRRLLISTSSRAAKWLRRCWLVCTRAPTIRHRSRPRHRIPTAQHHRRSPRASGHARRQPHREFVRGLRGTSRHCVPTQESQASNLAFAQSVGQRDNP